MSRIANVNIPKEKRIVIALTYIFGIGRKKSEEICQKTKIDFSKKVKDLTEEELEKIRQHIDKKVKVEGDLKMIINENVKRLKEIGSYRGVRHSKRLPSRGQRTKTNARTKRGKKVCVGSGRRKADAKT